MNMFVVIAGAGKVGSSLATWILDAGYEVAVIDIDDNKLKTLSSRLGDVVVLGDTISPNDLEKCGISRADIFIAATDVEDVNLISCQVVKSRYEVTTTAAVVFNSESEELFDLLGVDITLKVPDMIVQGLQERLSESFAVDL